LPAENHTPKVYTVTELTEEIKTLLEKRFEFVWLEGEISNFSSPVSGHYYMVVKDGKSQMRGVMFRPQTRYLKFVPENGMKVIAQGRVGVYPPRGEYQIILDYLEPMGVGALALAFEQLKKKLAAQGVFDKEIKKPLPFLPQKVAVITSPAGAAIQDFLKIIRRRFANIEIIIVPVRVQGEEATSDMVEALHLVNSTLQVDVIVLTRGGGSLEDLWAFNQEALALAIRRSKVPVVSAVGHEVDLTICDLAADFRAPTPSSAAELLVIEKESIQDRLNEVRKRLLALQGLVIKNKTLTLQHLAERLRDPRRGLAAEWMRLDEVYSRLMRLVESTLRSSVVRLKAEGRALLLGSPMSLISSRREQLTFARRSLGFSVRKGLSEKRMACSLAEERLKDLSPMSVLKRGYSIARRLPSREVLKDASAVDTGDRINVVLARGELDCRIETVGSDRRST
jgi:exodeoxyribonuclease VII large subunit